MVGRSWSGQPTLVARDLLECVDAEDLQDLIKASFQIELLRGDGHQEISANGLPDLARMHLRRAPIMFAPADVTRSPAGTLANPRYGHTATLLPDGKVLLAGGVNTGYPDHAELYDPVNRSWTVTGAMITTRQGHTATLLPDGKVLVAGGAVRSAISSAELHDPVTKRGCLPGPCASRA
jgi:hypothetical protein